MGWKFTKRLSETISCACGCNKKFDKYDDRNRERKYIVGHSGKVNGLGKFPHKVWNKGITGIHLSSKSEFKKGMTPWNKGMKGYGSGEKNPWFGKTGKDHPAWRGITAELELIRKGVPYRTWRKKVIERDGAKCIFCGSKESLQADHIKPFINFPHLRLELSNGRTLCTPCHKKTDTYGIKARNFI